MQTCKLDILTTFLPTISNYHFIVNKRQKDLLRVIFGKNNFNIYIKYFLYIFYISDSTIMAW